MYYLNMDHPTNLNDINQKIDNLIKKDNSRKKELLRFKEWLNQDELKDKFFHNLFLVNYIKDKARQKQCIKECKKLAEQISDLKGWPDDPTIFWNIESSGWHARLSKEIRHSIRLELNQMINNCDLNLSLGSGCYPYVINSVLLDISEDMLKNVLRFDKKIIYNMNIGCLPFKDNSFDSVSMIFVINYLKNPENVIKEVKRILKKEGRLIIIQSKKQINRLFEIQEKKVWNSIAISRLLRKNGFEVTSSSKKIGDITLEFTEGKI